MALTATFAADFKSFQDACAKAVVSLKGIETGAGNVEGKLNRMSDSLSGTKIIQQATLMAEAVERVGGVATLTDKELAKIGPTAQEAADKLRKLGQDVPPGIQKIADAAKKASTEGGFLDSTLIKLASAFSISSLVDKAVGSLISFGKAAIDDAGHLVDLSQKTGLSTKALQIYGQVAKESGSTLDDVAQAVFKLGVNVENGGKTITDSLTKLGLSYQEIRQLKPEEQFETIAQKLNQVANVQERNAAGVALFGKTWAQVAPAVAEGLDSIKDKTVIVGDEQIRAIDRAADRWDRFVSNTLKNVEAALGRIVGFFDRDTNADALLIQIRAVAEARDKAMAADAARKPGTIFGFQYTEMAALSSRTAILNQELVKLVEQYGKVTAASGAVASGTHSVSEAIPRVTAAVKDLGLETSRVQSLGGGKVFHSFFAEVETNVQRLPEQGRVFHAFFNEIRVGETVLEGLPISTVAASTAIVQMTNTIQLQSSRWAEFASGIKSGLLSALKSIPETLAAAFTGGGGIAGGLNAIVSQLGSTIGGGIGGIFGPLGAKIGSAIGSLASKAIAGLKNIFGGGEGAKVNDVRDLFAAEFGGLDKIHAKLIAIGREDLFKNLAFGPAKLAAIQKAIEDVRVAFGDAAAEQAEAQAFLQSAIEKYGFSIEELGPKFRAQQLSEQALQLAKEFTALTASGIDSGVVIEHMGDAIQSFVTDALKTGTEVPEALRKMLQEAANAGKLFDLSGNKIEDLTDSGIVFGQTLTQNFDRVITKLDELIHKITDGLGGALTNLPSPTIDIKIPRVPKIDNTGVINPDDLVGYFPEQPLASGGIVRRPTHALIGESGPEAVIPLSSFGPRPPQSSIVIDARGALFPDRDGLRALADMLTPVLPDAILRVVTR